MIPPNDKPYRSHFLLLLLRNRFTTVPQSAPSTLCIHRGAIWIAVYAKRECHCFLC
jgi:hypothetical protein